MITSRPENRPSGRPPNPPPERKEKDEELTRLFHQMLWSGFHKKVLKERQDFLRLLMPHVFADTHDGFPFQGLRGEAADHMVENCIG